MTKKQIRCRAVGVGLLLLYLQSTHAFLIPLHHWITEEALKSTPQIVGFDYDQIILGSSETDLTEGNLPIIGGPYTPNFHFDNESSYEAAAQNFERVGMLIDSCLKGRPRPDSYGFGKALHAIEDFYSHSNYIELYRDFTAAKADQLNGTIPPIEQVLLDPGQYHAFILMLRKSLRTGKYPNHFIPRPTDHGQFWGGPGMNKDREPRPLFYDAKQTAVRSASWYLRLWIKDKQVQQQWVTLRKQHFGR